MRQWCPAAVFRLVLLSSTLVGLSDGHDTPSAHAHAHTHEHVHGHEDSPFWAEGRIWTNYQEWSKSEEFKNNFPKYSCGTEEPTIDEMKTTNEVTKAWLKAHSCENPLISGRNPHCRYSAGSSFLRQSAANEPIPIQVKWHSIMRDDGGGGATQQQIVDSVAALNAAYTHSSGGFKFLFDPTTDLTLSYNSWWHFSDDIDDLQFKSVLREGGCTTLNIYSAASFAGIFGWGSKPFKCENGSCYNLCQAQQIDDGVVIRYDLVTGGPVEDFDEGDVLVHEVGHWLGLYHTFQGGDCSYPGDFIEDTPAERMPAFGCERVRDSCRGVDDLPSGLDPIHNYMNLSNDPCMFEFTDGQFAWMYAQWEAYRVAVDTATEAPTAAEPTTNPPTTMLPTRTSEPTTAEPTTNPPTTSSPTTAEPTLDTTTPPIPAITISPLPPTPGTIFTIPPFPFPPDYLTASPTTGPPSTTTTEVPTIPTAPPIREQKVAPATKCGTVASQSGYGGAAAQAKDCVSRSNDPGKTRRRIKGQ